MYTIYFYIMVMGMPLAVSCWRTAAATAPAVVEFTRI